MHIAPGALHAGLSTLWMGAGWNYYTVYSKADEPSIDTRSVAYPRLRLRRLRGCCSTRA
jgi:hypothetical protein